MIILTITLTVTINNKMYILNPIDFTWLAADRSVKMFD